jgi:hypothetical protein
MYVVLVICVALLLRVLLYVLFACNCVLYYCYRMSTQLQLTNISYFGRLTIIRQYLQNSEQDACCANSIYAHIYQSHTSLGRILYFRFGPNPFSHHLIIWLINISDAIS